MGVFVQESNFQITLGDLALKAPIEYLLQSIPDEVSNPGRNLTQSAGGLSVTSGGSASDVVDTFISLFPSLTIQQVKEALQSNESTGMLLLWKKLGVFTRINLKERIPDILFIWKQGGASSVSTDQIVERLWEGIKIAGQPQLVSANDYIKHLSSGDIIRASTLVQRFSIKQSDSAKLLLSAMRAGLMQRRFRVRTDAILEGFENIWRSRLEEFPKAVIDENGNDMNLTDPANIDVGYERVLSA